MVEFKYQCSAWFEKRNALRIKEAGECLVHLARKHKLMIPLDEIVNTARPPTSPLHPVFEWDDKKAADEYRLHQARHLVRCFTIDQTDVDTRYPHNIKVTKISFGVTDTERVVRVYADSPDPPKPYSPTIKRASEPPLRSNPLVGAAESLLIFKKQFGHLPDVQDIIQSINRFLVKMQEKKAA